MSAQKPRESARRFEIDVRRPYYEARTVREGLLIYNPDGTSGECITSTRHIAREEAR